MQLKARLLNLYKQHILSICIQQKACKCITYLTILKLKY